jgi:hypothetical protein
MLCGSNFFQTGSLPDAVHYNGIMKTSEGYFFRSFPGLYPVQVFAKITLPKQLIANRDFAYLLVAGQVQYSI